MNILVSFVVLLILWFSPSLSKKNGIYLDARFVYLSAFSIYAVLPFFGYAIGADVDNLSDEYGLVVIAAALGVNAAMWMIRFSFGRFLDAPLFLEITRSATNRFSLIYIFAFLFYVYDVFSGVAEFFGPRMVASGISSDGLMEGVSFSMILFIVVSIVFASSIAKNPKEYKFHCTILIVGVMFFCALNMLAGARMWLIVVLLPIISLFLDNHKLRILRILFVSTIGILFTNAIGVVRAYGWASNQWALTDFFTANIFLGEFAVWPRIYSLFIENMSREALRFGGTYIDALENLLPRYFFPDKVVVVSEKLSIASASYGQVVWGVGFNPVVEGAVNFGAIGFFVGPLIHTYIMFSIVRVFHFSRFSKLLVAVYLPFLFISMRSDFAVFVKTFSTYIILISIIVFISGLWFNSRMKKS